MRSSSFLVALQAGCLSMAAPTALGLHSHQKRTCAPGSIEAQESDYYHSLEKGTANQSQAVALCIRLTLPSPSQDNRPRTPSVVDLVPCDSQPQTPDADQMYIRLTLPDPKVHEGRRTPAIVDPSPFATYSAHHGGSGTVGLSSGAKGGSTKGSSPAASKGNSSGNAAAGQSNAGRPQGAASSAGSTSSGKSSSQQKQSAKGQDGSNKGSADDGSSNGTNGGGAKGPSATASKGNSSGNAAAGQPSGGRPQGAPPSAGPTSNGSSSTANGSSAQGKAGGASKDSGSDTRTSSQGAGTTTGGAASSSQNGSGMSQTGGNGASPNGGSGASPPNNGSGSGGGKSGGTSQPGSNPTSSTSGKDGNGPLLTVDAHVAALDHPGTSLSTANLLSAKVDVAKHPAHGVPPTGTPVDGVLGSDALVHVAAAVGQLDGASPVDASEGLVNGHLLEAKVHAAALNQDGSPVTNGLAVVAADASRASQALDNGSLLDAKVNAAALSNVGHPATNALNTAASVVHAVDTTVPPNSAHVGVEGDVSKVVSSVGDKVIGSANQDAADPSGSDSPVAALDTPSSSDLPSFQGIDSHLISVKAAVPAPNNAIDPTPGSVGQNPALPSASGSDTATLNAPSHSDLPSPNQGIDGQLINVTVAPPTPNVPEPNALLQVTGSVPNGVANGSLPSDAPVDDATHALLQVKATAP